MFNGKICTLWTRSHFYLMFLLRNQCWRCYWFQEPHLRNFSLLEVPGGNLREWNFACRILGAFYLYVTTMWITQELRLECKIEDSHSRASLKEKTAPPAVVFPSVPLHPQPPHIASIQRYRSPGQISPPLWPFSLAPMVPGSLLSPFLNLP